MTAAENKPGGKSMSKKLYTLISTLVSCVATGASAIVAYFQPNMTVAIIAAIGIGSTAINEIMVQFVEK